MRAWFLGVLFFFQPMFESILVASAFYTNSWQVAHYGEEVFEELDFTGYISLDGTKVRNRARIDGYVQARFAYFQNLYIKGHAKIQDSQVGEKCIIEGGLLAINVQFSQGLTCRSSKISLSHCRLPYLRIQGLADEEQILELCDGTEIFGPVIFESGNGKIVASQDSIPKMVQNGNVHIEDINRRY